MLHICIFSAVPVVIYGMRDIYEDHVGTKIEDANDTQNKDESQAKVRYKETFLTKQTVKEKSKNEINYDKSKEKTRVQIKED